MFGNYSTEINDALEFIRKSRATGTFNFTASYSETTIVSDDTYLSLSGSVAGSYNGYISNYNQLIAKTWYYSDVEYISVWQYEVNNAWYNWDTETWIDAWERDTSVGANGLVEGFADVDSSGNFGGVKILDTKTFTSTGPYLTWYPELNEGEGGYDLPYVSTSDTRNWKRKFLLSGADPQIRINRVSDDYLLGSLSANDRIWQGITHFSFLIEPDDVNYNGTPPTSGVRLNARCWVYTEALIVMAYISMGLYSEAHETLKRLALEQYADFAAAPQYNGAWGFSFDVYIGRIPEQDYVRNGAVGWVLWAYLIYKLKTGSAEFDDTIYQGLRYLSKEQIRDRNDVRYGLIPLGWNRYDVLYYLENRQEAACALEHNVDIWQVYRLAYTVFQDEAYKRTAQTIETAIYKNLLADGYFYQGISPTAVDTELALDCNTWGLNFKIASQNFENNKQFYDFLISTYLVSDTVATDDVNLWYEYASSVSGFKPYDYTGSPTQPIYPWIEGTLGAISALFKSGKMVQALSYVDGTLIPLMYDMTNNPNHGLITMTTAVPEIPWEFNIWLTALNSAWMIVTLRNNDYLWTPITKEVNEYTISQF